MATQERLIARGDFKQLSKTRASLSLHSSMRTESTHLLSKAAISSLGMSSLGPTCSQPQSSLSIERRTCIYHPGFVLQQFVPPAKHPRQWALISVSILSYNHDCKVPNIMMRKSLADVLLVSTLLFQR